VVLTEIIISDMKFYEQYWNRMSVGRERVTTLPSPDRD
jgi:hypothetical protein